ncbi:hypothetical protein IB237_11635 [Agrobacterium sp. AGB01]|uniref:hypothetical protein n=1 Tax=Agrobacterium sp. AGB01 TaxID=2769302 RepID=UPI0017833966|nr:hypothetical protein [Agrobacterium sp. AGB01]MBD9387828.1 hypothetical protein [Agrobacterium sp. AGB01]
MVVSSNDAKIMIGMVARGDDQHNVAAWFGENQGRVADALSGKYGTTDAAPKNELPPSGPPGMKGRRLRYKAIKAIEALEAGDSTTALSLLKEGIENFNKNE